MINPEELTEDDFYANEIDLCKEDCEFFIENYVKIHDPDSEAVAIPFKLWDSNIPNYKTYGNRYPNQKEVLARLLTKRLIQILKARQLGLTWLALSYITWQLLFRPGFLVVGLSRGDDEAKELVTRVDFILRYLPRWFLPEDRWTKTTEKIVIRHYDKEGKRLEDSIFQSFSAAQDSGRSFTANIVIIDEWALQQWAREIWQAAFPTVNRPAGGQVIGISTIRRGTLFEEIWTDKNSIFEKIFLPWYADPRRDQKWYDDTANTMKETIFSEYPATPEEALRIPGGVYFGDFNTLIHIKPPLPQIPVWYSKYRFMDYGMDMLACYFIYVDKYGYARIYREIHEKGYTISHAAYEILKVSGADVPESAEIWTGMSTEERKEIAKTSKERFVCTYAPPDLFDKSGQTGRSSDEIWIENGIVLTKTKNAFEQGCIAVSQWIKPFVTKDEQTGEEYKTARLTIDGYLKDGLLDWSVAPNLVHSFLNIQKDKNREEVYSKNPHILTHPIDACRYFCTEFILSSINQQEEEEKKQQRLRDTAYPHLLDEDEKISDPDLVM